MTTLRFAYRILRAAWITLAQTAYVFTPEAMREVKGDQWGQMLDFMEIVFKIEMGFRP